MCNPLLLERLLQTYATPRWGSSSLERYFLKHRPVAEIFSFQGKDSSDSKSLVKGALPPFFWISCSGAKSQGEFFSDIKSQGQEYFPVLRRNFTNTWSRSRVHFCSLNRLLQYLIPWEGIPSFSLGETCSCSLNRLTRPLIT